MRPRRLPAGRSGHRLDVQLLAQVLNFVYAGIDLLQSQLRGRVTKCVLSVIKMSPVKTHAQNSFTFWFSEDTGQEARGNV